MGRDGGFGLHAAFRFFHLLSCFWRGLCGYMAIFWGMRLLLQRVFDAKERLTTWWLKIGYNFLTVLLVSFTLIYGCAALRLLP